MIRRNQYFVGVLVISPLWLVASFMLAIMLLNADDPGLPIGEIATYVNGDEIVSFDPNYKGEHQGEFPPVPLWLKVANGIAVPLIYILPDPIRGLSGHANGIIGLLAVLISSILWAFTLVFLFRQLAFFLRMKNDR